MAFVSTEIMTAGKAAKAEGKPMEANPYPAGSQDSVDWLEGYTAGEAEQNVDHDDPSDSNRS